MWGTFWPVSPVIATAMASVETWLFSSHVDRPRQPMPLPTNARKVSPYNCFVEVIWWKIADGLKLEAFSVCSRVHSDHDAARTSNSLSKLRRKFSVLWKGAEFSKTQSIETLMWHVGKPIFHALWSLAILQILCHWSASDRVFLNLGRDDDDALYNHET